MTTAPQSPSEVLAEAFDRWRQLDLAVAQDPRRVSPEQMAEAWEALLEAHEQWANAR